jgi:hypothetical protein
VFVEKKFFCSTLSEVENFLPCERILINVITKRQANFKDFKRFGAFKGLVEQKKKTECVVKTHDRSKTFVLQGNIVIIHQSLLNSIFTTKLYILMKKINYKQR